jgi:hypothetical protein
MTPRLKISAVIPLLEEGLGVVGLMNRLKRTNSATIIENIAIY